jgi:hypothetical protein
MSSEILISGTVLHGYAFRHLFAGLKGVFPDVSLIFSKRGLRSINALSKERVLVSFEVYGEQITEYVFSVSEGKVQKDEFKVKVKLNDMMSALSACTKKDSFAFQITDQSYMNFRMIPPKAGNEVVEMKIYFIANCEFEEYEVPVLKRQIYEPNLSIATSSFSSACKQINKQKGIVSLVMHARGIEICGNKANGQDLCRYRHGEFPEIANVKTIADAGAAAVAAVTKVAGALSADFKDHPQLGTMASLAGSMFPSGTDLKEVSQVASVAASMVNNGLRLVLRDHPTINVTPQISKAFSNLSRLNPDNPTQFYADSGGKIIKIRSSVSSFGHIEFFLIGN